MIRHFSVTQYAQALEAWSFVDLADKQPLFASPFGDVFLRGPRGVWVLDTVDGALSRPWHTEEEMQTELSTPEGRDRYLLTGLASAAAEHGLVPGPDQVYGFAQPPVLGGQLEVGNVEVVDFVVGVNVAGQIHAQVRDLPPGTTVTGVTLDD